MIETILIAFALCIDSFALGVAYGIKKIKIPSLSILIISIITICVLGVSVLIGHIIRQFISGFTATLISSIVLIGLGSFFMLEGYIKYFVANKGTVISDNKLMNLYIPKIGFIIDIALDVSKADFDISGDINNKEALYLGIILSIDSLGAGFGYAMGNANILYFLIIVFFINIISISLGLRIGHKVEQFQANLKTSLLPGFILILIGVLKWVW
jgi:putative sporulation protein YtaF